MAGLTSTGFDIKPLADILTDIQTVELQEISPSLDVQPTALIGVCNGIVAQAAFELWQLGAALYNGMDPDQATADQLASLALITGTVREPATQTQVLAVDVNVNAGFSAAAGTMFASIVGNPAAQFVNKSLVSNPAGSPATIDADFEAVNAGPTQCLSGTLTVIAQPLSGWNSVTNPTDGIVGSNIENDASLRLRRQEELSAAGSTTASAIKSDVLAQMQPPTTTSATTSCTVLYNDTDATDANGLPPHTIEVIARQPGATSADDLALATLILNNKAAGIGTHGNSSKVVVDSQGNSETVYFTRPTDTNIYIAITVVTDPDTFPSDGATQVKNTLLAYGVAEYQPGVTVYALRLKSVPLPDPRFVGEGVTGVLDVSAFTVDTANPPVATSNIVIDIRHVAVLDSARIAVTVT